MPISIDGLYREILAGFSPKVIAETNSVICCDVIRVRPGVRENRASAEKREGEDESMGIRSGFWTKGSARGELCLTVAC